MSPEGVDGRGEADGFPVNPPEVAEPHDGNKMPPAGEPALSSATPDVSPPFEPALSSATPDVPPPGYVRGGEPGTADAPDSGVKGERVRRNARGIVLETLFLFLIAALVALLVQSFVIKAFMIPSSSMSPTLQIGDRVMVEKLTYYFRKPRRGDIVVFRYPPRQPGAMNTARWYYWPFEQIAETLRLAHRGVTPYVKRVVATGGETVELKKGKLYIDGKMVEEDYVTDESSDYGPMVVPEDGLFMMGDNRLNSRDSRFWGTVPLRSVIGKVFLIWWPPGRFTTPD